MSKVKTQLLTGDFETTTDPLDVRVWASCMVDINLLEVVQLGNNIEGFIEYVRSRNTKVYYHNLKFDGEYIIYWLLTNGFECNNSKKPNTFTTLISDMGTFYNITIYFAKHNKSYHKCSICDSLKKLPMKVSQISKAFALAETKLTIDYHEKRAVGHVLTEHEKEYIISDCMIVAKALNQQFAKGLVRMTVGADALNGFKETIGKKNFDRWFPILPLDTDKEIRTAYRGGYTYLNPKRKGKRMSGQVYDVNSLYPSVMYQCPMPWGYPVPFIGEYIQDDKYPLYIVQFRCDFKVKKGYLPTVQLKGNNAYVQTEYLSNSKGEFPFMSMTNVDYDLFRKHYDVIDLEFIGGHKFKKCEGIFKDYIDFWSEIKANATGGMRTLAKLMLNSLYGKFATNPLHKSKSPYLNHKGVVAYTDNPDELTDPVYTAVGVFITAFARKKMIETAQASFDEFIYCDTDSLHVEGDQEPNIDIHPSRLGAWKCEGHFTDSKFLRAKTYMETVDGVTSVKCAGMPDNVKTLVNYENFTNGAKYGGDDTPEQYRKLSPKRYAGGIVLEPTDFTIKQ